MKLIELNYGDWHDQFKPVKNHLDRGAASEGTMFETYNEELDFVRESAEKDELKVWTLMDSEEDDDAVIVEGYHWVNRIGYYVTEVPAEKNTNYLIK